MKNKVLLVLIFLAIDTFALYDKTLQLALNGDSNAQVEVGDRYYSSDFGRKTPDYAEALKWYTMAAAQGNGKAQYKIGSMYESGVGVERDVVVAENLYRKAAKKGDSAAIFSLGFILESRDDAKAADWYIRYEASESKYFGDAGRGFFRIGYMHYAGKGFPENKTRAAVWFKKAMAKNNSQAGCFLGAMHIYGQGVKPNFDKATELLARTTNFSCAEPHLLKLAEFGNEPALIYLANRYSGEAAFKWLKILSDKGHAESQYKLAKMYRSGNGILENDSKALMWFQEAAAQGNAAAQASLGDMYQDGEGISKNNIKAFIWKSVAKQQGHYASLYRLKEELSVRQLNKAQELASKCYESNFQDCDPWLAW